MAAASASESSEAAEVELMIPKEEAPATGVTVGNPEVPTSEKMFGLPIKYLALVMLVFQNTSNVLVLRYARTIPGVQFLATT